MSRTELNSEGGMLKWLKVLVVCLIATFAFAKHKQPVVNPADFDLVLKVTGYSLRTQVAGMTSSRPSFCDTQKEAWQRTYCAAAGNRSYAYTEDSYIITAELGDRVYELSSEQKLALGEYKAKHGIAKDGSPYIDVLGTDKKGHPVGSVYWIVGEHIRTAEQSQHQ